MRIISHFFIVCVLFVAATITNAQPANLFVPLPEPGNADRLAKKSLSGQAKLSDISAKQKQVGVNTPVLATIPEALIIDLFGDQVTAVLDKTEKVSAESVSWIGHIGTLENEVILVINGSLVQGNILYKNRQYQIRYQGKLGDTALHMLRLVDPKKLRDEHPPGFVGKMRNEALKKRQPVSPAINTANKQVAQADVQVDSGAFIDVMVLWTPAARQGAGGTAAIGALIDLSFVEANQSYANSGITHRLRLAHKQEVNFTESDSVTTNLNRLGNPSDGYIDNIHALRDTYKADLVSLFISVPGFYCGVADTPVGSFWDQAAFSVVDYRCAVDNRSFAHETGHNFSALHDWRTDSQTSVYPYSHGHLHDGNNSWRTIMSYFKCTGSGPCTRLNYWSNPDKQYNGVAMGVAEGAAQATDNRKALNNAASFVANYRVSGTQTGTNFNWDIDGDGSAQALTDGLLILRYLFNFTDATLTNNAVGSGASRSHATQIQNYLKTAFDNGTLDIDGNGHTEALTDGLLVLRYLFNFSGDSLTNNAIGTSATRKNAASISAYLQTKMP